MSDQTIMVTETAAGFIGFKVAWALLATGRDYFVHDRLNARYAPALKRARLNVLREYPQFSVLQNNPADCVVVASLFARRHLRFTARTQKGRFPLLKRRAIP
jgi:UDP-glucuronate 4-epimerase